MTDYDMILHEIVRTRGSESVVRQILSADEYWHNMREGNPDWDYEPVTDTMVRFEASRAAYKIAQRNKTLDNTA